MIDPPGVRVVLLDVEGTTTSVSFVYDVLFPYARAHLAEVLRDAPQDAGVRDDIEALRVERAAETAADAPQWRAGAPEQVLDSAIAYGLWLMDRDRKSTALKSLQGRIWQRGYAEGMLVSHVYPDVAPALKRWRGQGRSIAIFSSGSVLAQRLLFGHTSEGDLTPWLDAYFDTTTGPKRDPASYRRIAEALGADPRAVIFVSDVVEELDAARASGLSTALCVRAPGPAPAGGHPILRTFDELGA
ncbi:MAG TPA: acireductone synthase [Vicinamibacteria bacterium]|nr:acireductone synthase [Vicinamibacteria bacterium]